MTEPLSERVRDLLQYAAKDGAIEMDAGTLGAWVAEAAALESRLANTEAHSDAMAEVCRILLPGAVGVVADAVPPAVRGIVAERDALKAQVDAAFKRPWDGRRADETGFFGCGCGNPIAVAARATCWIPPEARIVILGARLDDALSPNPLPELVSKPRLDDAKALADELADAVARLRATERKCGTTLYVKEVAEANAALDAAVAKHKAMKENRT